MGCILESEYGNEVSAVLPAVALISADHVNGKIYLHDGLTANVKTSFSPENPLSGGSLALAGGDLIVVFRTTVGEVYRMDGISGTVKSNFLLGHVGDIHVHNGNLISIQRQEGVHDQIRIHDGISATVSSSFNAPTEDAMQGLTVDSSGNLITASADSDLIYIHDGITSTVSSSFAAPGEQIQALAMAPGDILISSDRDLDTIYIHDGITSTVMLSFASPGPHVGGLVVLS